MTDTLNQIKVLNLYAGIGGNRKLWKGAQVTALVVEDFFKPEVGYTIISDNKKD